MSHLLLSTSFGSIKLRLREDTAPKTCEFMKKLVAQNLFEGCCFYRAESFCLQGGLSKADGSKVKHALGTVPLEYGPSNTAGTVAMARWDDPNTGSGEFFINLTESPHLDKTGTEGYAAGFAVWAEVESGLDDVCKAIAAQPTTKRGGLNMLVTPVPFSIKVTNG